MDIGVNWGLGFVNWKEDSRRNDEKMAVDLSDSYSCDPGCCRCDPG